MAQITGLHERQLALKDIQDMLKSLETLNLFLLTPNPSKEYTIRFDKIKVSILCESKETIDAFVMEQKAVIVEKINATATAHSIALDEEDLKIMKELYVTNLSKRSQAGSNSNNA